MATCHHCITCIAIHFGLYSFSVEPHQFVVHKICQVTKFRNASAHNENGLTNLSIAEQSHMSELMGRPLASAMG